jgi:hypothetical protein
MPVGGDSFLTIHGDAGMLRVSALLKSPPWPVKFNQEKAELGFGNPDALTPAIQQQCGKHRSKGDEGGLVQVMKNATRLLVIVGQRAHYLEAILRDKECQYDVTFRADLLTGLDQLKTKTFDAIVMGMSRTDVVPASDVMKVLEKAVDTPVIIVGSDEEKQVPGKGTAAGKWCEALIARKYSAPSLERMVSLAVNTDETAVEELTGGRDNRELLVSHLSHECRNSLACIHQFGHILNDGLAGEMTPEQRDYVGIMLDNASRIRDVIDDLLEPGAHEAKLAKAANSCL